jgi:hypothetical protein
MGKKRGEGASLRGKQTGEGVAFAGLPTFTHAVMTATVRNARQRGTLGKRLTANPPAGFSGRFASGLEARINQRL